MEMESEVGYVGFCFSKCITWCIIKAVKEVDIFEYNWASTSTGFRTEQNKVRRTAIHMIKAGKMILEDITDYTELPLDTVR